VRLRKDRMRSARAGWAWVLLALASVGAAAQQPLELNMASVANLARTRSWTAKQAHQNAAAADAVRRQTESLRWGQVNFDTQYLRFDGPIETASPVPVAFQALLGKSLITPVAPIDNLHVAFQAGVPLFTGGKITSAIHEAKAGAKAAASVASDTDDDVVLEAERNYLAVLLTRQVVELNTQALRSYKGHLDHAQSAFRQGIAAKYDVIRAEAAVAEQEKRLTEATNQAALAEAALRTSLALEDAEAINIDGKLFAIDEQVDLEQSMAKAVEASPILKALQQKVAASRSAVRVEQADYLPQVTGIANKEMVDNKLAETDPRWAIGAQAKLNLFDGGERRARVSVARAHLQAAESEYRGAEDKIRLAVRSSYLDLQSTREQLVSAQKAEQLATESLRLATKRFEVGTGVSLEVLDANVSLTASQVGIQQALYGMDLAYLGVHRYQGDIFEVSARIQK